MTTQGDRQQRFPFDSKLACGCDFLSVAHTETTHSSVTVIRPVMERKKEQVIKKEGEGGKGRGEIQM